MASDEEVCIRLLGGFDVLVDGRSRCTPALPARRPRELVQLLALADGHSLHREQVIDALWPQLPATAGAANLRKAAHLARQALEDPEAVVLSGGRVALFPGRVLRTDVRDFEAAAAAALRDGNPGACAEAAASYGGELLPEARYEEWSVRRREQLRERHLDLLRASGSWEQLVELEPADESAYCQLMRRALAAGNPAAALRWHGRLRTALAHELGVQPGPEAQALHDQCAAVLQTASPPLVGRDVELAHLSAALHQAARGQLSALAIQGPAGIGKSALCQSIAASARQQGWRVVPVQLAAAGGPYSPLVLAVEQLLRQEPRIVDALPAAARGVLAALTPSVVGQPAASSVTRHQVIGAVRRLLLAAGRGARVLLLVDDLHLADDDGVSALLHLPGISTSGAMLVVVAHRATPDPSALGAAMARLERAGRATTVGLAPLDVREAAELVAAAATEPPPDDVVAQVVERAAGNPFLLIELTRQACAGTLPEASTSFWQAVTRRFVDADLDEQARGMLQTLAVAGDQLVPAHVVAVTGLAERAAFALLDSALAAGVLVASGDGYAFRHALVREALLAQVPPHRRTGVHRDAARRLAAAGAPPEVVARHWLAAEQPQQAIPFLEAAARRAAHLGAFVDALAHLDVLLAHAPDSAAGLHLRAQALEALGDRRAPTAFAAAANAAPEHERDEVRARQALASVRAGDPAGAVAALEGVEARSLQGRLAQALAVAGAAAMGFADPDVGVARAAETRRLAVASGDASAVVIATWAEAAAAHAKGELPATLWEGLQETYALPDLAITTFDGQLCVAERLLYGYQPYPDVIGFADALENESVRRGAARGRAFAMTLRGEAWLLSGHLDRATADLSGGARLHRAIGACAGEALSLQRMAEVTLLSGDREGALALLEEALAVARDSALGFHLFDRIYGTRISAAADRAAAHAAVEEAEDAVHGALETCPGCRIALAVPAAIASARAGDVERALRYEAAAEQLTAVLMRLPGWYAALDEVRGERARAQGDRPAAGRHLRSAAARFHEAGQPLDSQRCAAAAVLLETAHR